MSKWENSQEDLEDYEQEKRIKDWLGNKGDSGFSFAYINANGNARSSKVRASFSLDQKISKDGFGGTFADVIAGSDVRDRYDEPEPPEPEEVISGLLSGLRIKGKLQQWVLKKLKSSIEHGTTLSRRSQTDSEW